MDTHKVPKEIRYKDQVIGPLSVRQALIVGIFAIPAYAIFRCPLALPLRILLIAPLFACGFALAFYPHKGKPLDTWLFYWISYKIAPKRFAHVDEKPPATILQLVSSLWHRDKGAPSPISSQVPIQGIARNLIKTTTGFAMVLRVNSLNFKLMSDDAKRKKWSSFRSFLNVLSLGFPIQFVIRTRKQTTDHISKHFDEVIERQPTPERAELAAAERDFTLSTVKDSSIVSRRFYLVVPYNPSFSTDADVTSVFRQAFSSRKSRGEVADLDIAYKQLSARRDQLVSHLKTVGIEATQLEDPDLFALIYDGFNPSLAGGGFIKHDLVNYYEHIEPGRVSNRLQPSYLEVGKDYADLSGIYLRTVYPLDYPGHIYNGWLQSLVDLDQDLDISLHISPLDNNSVIKVLNRNLSKILSTKYARKHKGQTEDFTLEAQSDDQVYLLEKLVRNETRLFNVGLYATARATSKEQLDTDTDSLLATMEALQITPAVATYQMSSAVATNVPIAQDRLCYTRNFDSDSLADTFPLTSSDLNSEGGVLVGINPDNNSLITMDIFGGDTINSNQIVLGSSGGGKSVYCKLLQMRNVLEGVSVVCIDPEREYENLCRVLGGQYVNLSRDPDHHINPFDPYTAAGGVRGMDRQVADSLVLIYLMCPGLGVPKSRLEELLYSMFKEKEAPLMADLYRHAKERDMGELTEALYPWHQGSLRHIFSQPTDVDLSSDYVVFDISEMDSDLRPVAMQVILSWLWREIFSNPKPRLVFVDEAWCLLEHAGDWFSAAYRRARKHWCGMCITEHQVETLFSSDVMKAILTNSATKVLFSQEASAIRALTDAFDLTAGEENSILGAGPGEGLLYMGNTHVSLKVLLPDAYKPFITTNPEDLGREVADG
ncbi:MAG: PrgI family protein [Actinobacteria bacterium]|nr:PrgI family protein [Actinomycetota bacterium]